MRPRPRAQRLSVRRRTTFPQGVDDSELLESGPQRARRWTKQQKKEDLGPLGEPSMLHSSSPEQSVDGRPRGTAQALQHGRGQDVGGGAIVERQDNVV